MEDAEEEDELDEERLKEVRSLAGEKRAEILLKRVEGILYGADDGFARLTACPPEVRSG